MKIASSIVMRTKFNNKPVNVGVTLYTREEDAVSELGADDAAELFTNHSQDSGLPWAMRNARAEDEDIKIAVAFPLHEMDYGTRADELFDALESYAEEVALAAIQRVSVDDPIGKGALHIAVRQGALTALCVDNESKLNTDNGAVFVGLKAAIRCAAILGSPKADQFRRTMNSERVMESGADCGPGWIAANGKVD